MAIAVTKPAVRAVWASAAAAGSLVDPDIANPNYTAAGWPLSTQPPPRQYFNFEFNYLHNAVAYWNRRGATDWDANQTYFINDVALGANGILYQSTQNNNTNNNPATSPAFWGGLNGYQVSGALGGFITQAQLNSALVPYETQAALSATLSNYATITYANGIGNSAISQSEAYTNSALGNYYTQAQVNSILGGYVTNGNLAANLANYSTLQYLNNGFFTAAYVNANFYTAAAVNSLLTGYVPNATFNQNVLNLEAYANSVAASSTATSEAYTNSAVAAARGTFGNGGVNGTSNALFGNGLQMRWGYSPAGTGSPRAISFPSFSNNILFGLVSAGEGAVGSCAITITGPASCSLTIGNSASGYYWVVFGY